MEAIRTLAAEHGMARWKAWPTMARIMP
jgi:hypothetical protein